MNTQTINAACPTSRELVEQMTRLDEPTRARHTQRVRSQRVSLNKSKRPPAHTSDDDSRYIAGLTNCGSPRSFIRY